MKHTPGFTLIEMIVVITIISIIALAVTNIDFSRLSARQKHEIFTNNIITQIETIRNYSFQGKWIGINLDTPDTWQIDISWNASWSIVTTYSWAVSGTYLPATFNVNPGYQITNIECKNLDESTVSSISGTWSIFFSYDTVNLAGCSPTTLKILEFTTSFAEYSDIIRVNTINGIIEKK